MRRILKNGALPVMEGKRMRKGLFFIVLMLAVIFASGVAWAAPWVTAEGIDKETGESLGEVKDWSAAVRLSRGSIPIYELEMQWRPGVVYGNTFGVAVDKNYGLFGKDAPILVFVEKASNMEMANTEDEVISDADYLFKFTGAVIREKDPIAIEGCIQYGNGELVPFRVSWEARGTNVGFWIGVDPTEEE